MAALRKALRRYEEPLAQRQFQRDHRFPDLTRYTRADRHSLTFDRVMGRDLRLFLAIGLPDPEIEAESPFWAVHNFAWPPDAPPELNPNDFTLEHALSCAWQFLETCGFAWFDDPLSLDPTEWRVKYRLRVRDHRQVQVTLSWPATMPVNERIMQSKRCIPSFRTRPATQLREYFLGEVDALHLGAMPLANALELRKTVEKHGLILDFTRA
jgi:hypothetical protein